MTVLAVLLGVLLGSAAPSAAGTERDPRVARSDQAQLVKLAAGQRVRNGDGEADETAALPPRPQVLTRQLALGAATSFSHRAAVTPLRRRPSAYRARAPPAA